MLYRNQTIARPDRHQVNIDFRDENVPQHLPKDVSLCLFRVAQEALRNAVKYCGSAQFRVQLTMVANEVQLEVKDNGVGFEVNEAEANRGLGLVSMQERAHLVRGELFVESEPGKGASIGPSFAVNGEGIEAARVTGAA